MCNQNTAPRNIKLAQTYHFTSWSSGASNIHFLCHEKFTLGQCMIRITDLSIYSRTRYHWTNAPLPFDQSLPWETQPPILPNFLMEFDQIFPWKYNLPFGELSPWKYNLLFQFSPNLTKFYLRITISPFTAFAIGNIKANQTN